MKKHLMQAALIAVMTLLSTNTRAEVDSNFYIYLCIGQSNMEGQGTIEDCDLSPDERFQMMSTLDCGTRKQGQWYRAVPPLARCDTRLCPADYFGRTMVANLDEDKRVGVVVVAIGGIKIDLYDPDGWQSYVNSMTEGWQINSVNAYGGNPLARLIECAKEAQKSGVIKGILLHQGESDAYSDTWVQKVKKVYENLLTELNLKAEDVPLIAGEVGSADQNGGCAHANPTINRLPNTIPTAHVVSSVGCTLQSDNIHFDSQGYRKLGRRYAKTILATMGIEADIDEDEVPEIDYSEPVDIINRFTYCWNTAETVTSEGGILVYNGVQWGGLACWLGEADWSEYAKLVFEFAEPTPIATQIFIQGVGNVDIAKVWVNAGAEKAECLFASHDVSKVSQVALQAADAGTVKISKIYLLRQAPTSIRQTEISNGEESRQWYLLNGQPVPQGFNGITVSKGKKVMRP
jgi:lysophospholipase L1-like esterase